jgi:glycosyltransferase involved in cell wall biosynthesis
MPTVSVIIPTYNREHYVVETVESALAQTLEDVEVVVVDDGSTDDTRHVLSQFGSRIRYVYQENRGRSSARNRGIVETTGRYILFLDSDDLLLPPALESLATFLDAHPGVGLAYSDGYYCDADGVCFRKLSSLRPVIDHDRPLETLVMMNFIIAPHSAMVRRRHLEAIGPPYFDEALTGPEDTDLWIRLAAAGCRFGYIDGLICKYRWHGTNTFSPRSEIAPQAWESIKRFKLKILNSGYFPGLALETQRLFLYQLLVHDLRGSPEEQQAVLEHDQFQALPEDVKAALWYLVGIDNVIDGQQPDLGRVQLRTACRLAPANPKYTGALLTSRLSRSLLGELVQARRKLQRALRREPPIRSPFDPRFIKEGDASP